MTQPAERYALHGVFNEAAFPEIVFVPPSEYKYVRASLQAPGKHVTVFGPSGTGKTTIIERLLLDLKINESDIHWINGRQYAGVESGLHVLAQSLGAEPNFDEVTDLLKLVKYIVVDDFHFLHAVARNEIAANLKLWHEKKVRFVIIGIATSAEELFKVDQELGIRNDPYELKQQSSEFIAKILALGCKALNIEFTKELAANIVETSNGVPSIAHVIGRICCIASDIEETQEETKVIDLSLKELKHEVLRIFHGKYRDKVVALAKGKQQARSVHNTYFDIVSCIIKIDSSEIPQERLYRSIVGSIEDTKERGKKATSFYNCLNNLSEVIEQQGLNDTILYNKGGKYISIEDPSFRFYLNLIDVDEIRSRIHLRPNQYPWDVALSFAGDVRPVVHEFATALKSRGLSVFYDFDQQIQLWGKDLRIKLSEVYAEEALYMVVFLSESYPTRDWTDLELSVGKAAAEKRPEEYLLPLRLDNVNVVGIKSTIGHLDLYEIGIENAADILAEKVAGANAH